MLSFKLGWKGVGDIYNKIIVFTKKGRRHLDSVPGTKQTEKASWPLALPQPRNYKCILGERKCILWQGPHN